MLLNDILSHQRVGESMSGFLIAETDEIGNVEWVWVKRKTHKAPMPLDRNNFKASDISEFEIHGASRKAVTDWLNQGQRPRV